MRVVWGRHEGIEMIETILGALIAANFLAMWHIYISLKKLENKISEGIDDINVEIPAIDSIKDEIVDTIIDALSQIRQPTFLDHIGGAVGNILQARAAKMMNNLALEQENPNMTNPNSDIYG